MIAAVSTKKSLAACIIAVHVCAAKSHPSVPCPVTCKPDMLIPDVLKQFDENDTEALPITDENGMLLGVVEKPAVDHYLHARVMELHKKIASLG